MRRLGALLLGLAPRARAGVDDGADGAPRRAPARALAYVEAASMGGGSWGRLPRRAFDALVRGGAPERALLLYAEAAELGCEFRGTARLRVLRPSGMKKA